MNLSADELQREVLNAVDRILERNVTAQRTRKLVETDCYDEQLHEALFESGFMNLPLSGGGPLEAALVAERVAQHAGLVPYSATGLIYPMLMGHAAPGPVAVCTSAGAPFRLGRFAKVLLVLDEDRAIRLEPQADDLERVDSDGTGWPLARLKQGAVRRGTSLGEGSGDALLNWWRTALAVDLAGTMRGALATTVRYVSERIQFNRPIGSFQSIQHRLAQLTTQVEGAYWLAMEAAYQCADPVAAARAATFAVSAAPVVLRETHQMHGAMGFTREYPLHLYTMRLPALQRELGGLKSHARALAALR